VDVSPSLISEVTDKIQEEVKLWRGIRRSRTLFRREAEHHRSEATLAS